LVPVSVVLSLYSPNSPLTMCVVACEEVLSPMSLNILGNPAMERAVK
jgi:hypothetical protein